MTLAGSPRKWLLIGSALIVLGLVKVALIGWYWSQRGARHSMATELLSCYPERSACALPGGGRIEFAAPPQGGRAFAIRLSGVAAAEAPSAEFGMAQMDMGFNRYRFVPEGTGWRADVTLPLCASGARDWLLTLALDGRRYQLPFHAQ